MAWDDSEFTSPDYSMYEGDPNFSDYLGDSNYTFDPSFTDYYGDSSFMPEGYESMGYENPTFDLYDQLAQSGIIGQDSYGMPDLSALYAMDPEMASDIGAGTEYSPDQLQGLASNLSSPMQSTLQTAMAADPVAAAGIQQVGPGMYLDSSGKLLDEVQLQDKLTQISQPSTGQMRGFQSSPFGTSPYTNDIGITGMYSPSGDPRSQQFMTLTRDELSNSGGVGTPLGEGLTDPYMAERAQESGPNYGALMKLLNTSFGSMGSPNTSSASKTATLPLQQRDAQGNLTKAQTGLNTAAMMAMIGEAMRNKSVNATPGAGDLRGADAWSVGRAAGSGRKKKAEGGLAAYAKGGHVSDPYSHGGQADTVKALLSGGEYVMDADVVSSLGDGDTNAGAFKLDQMRQAVRKHKRSAPSGKIPPKAKSPLEYMKGAK